MHEIAFAKSVLNDIEGVREKDKEISTINIELGELVGIEKEELLETLEKLSKWKYEVSEKRSFVKCKCGHIGPAEIKERLHDLVVYVCPKCKEVPKVIEGDKVKISRIIYR